MILPHHEYLFNFRTLEQRLNTTYDNLSAWVRSVEEAILVVHHQDAALCEESQTILSKDLLINGVPSWKMVHIHLAAVTTCKQHPQPQHTRNIIFWHVVLQCPMTRQFLGIIKFHRGDDSSRKLPCSTDQHQLGYNERLIKQLMTFPTMRKPSASGARCDPPSGALDSDRHT